MYERVNCRRESDNESRTGETEQLTHVTVHKISRNAKVEFEVLWMEENVTLKRAYGKQIVNLESSWIRMSRRCLHLLLQVERRRTAQKSLAYHQGCSDTGKSAYTRNSERTSRKTAGYKNIKKFSKIM